MDRDQKRSQTWEKFPPIPPGRTFLSSSTECAEYERPANRQYMQKRIIHPVEPTKRQRPDSGRSSASLKEDIKRQRPGSGHSVASVMEGIQRQKSNNAHCLNLVTEEMKLQRPGSGRSLIYAVEEEIKRQRPGSGRYLEHAVEEEIQRQRPGSGLSGTSVVEGIKRQKSSNAHALNSVVEEIKYQRPSSGQNFIAYQETTEAPTMFGNIPTSAEFDDKAARSSSRMDILQEQAKSEEERLKSFSTQQFKNVISPTPSLCANSSDFAINSAQTAAVDAKAERKRKRKEKKEREARKLEEARRKEQEKLEEARRKEQEKLEAEKMIAELSRNRSMFNGNKDTLPAIGCKTAEVNFYIGKLPTIKSHDPFAPTLPENNAVDVIRKHETQVRTTAFLREISQDYINASAQLMEPFRKNDAVEIIESHEEEFGRSYTSSYLTRNYESADKSSSAKSRCSSRVSRFGAP